MGSRRVGQDLAIEQQAQCKGVEWGRGGRGGSEMGWEEDKTGIAGMEDGQLSPGKVAGSEVEA